MADPVFVDVGHPYTARAFAEGKRSGEEKTFRARTSVALRAVDADETELVASLGLGDGEIDVRFHEGSFWRPLIEPAAAVPINVERFAELAEGFVSWRENPFIRKSAAHYVLPEDRPNAPRFLQSAVSFYASDWRRVEQSMLKQAESDMHAAAGDLLVVDGIVHRRTEAPILLLKTTTIQNRAQRGYRLTWHVPFLEGDDDDMGPTTRMPIAGGTAMGSRIPFASVPWRRFSLVDLDLAREVAETLGRLRRMPVEVLDGVAVHRPDLLPRTDIDAVPLEILAREAVSALKVRVGDMPRHVVESWLDARDALEGEDFERAIDTIHSIALTLETANGINWGALDYRNLAGKHGMDGEGVMSAVIRHGTMRARGDTLDADDLAALSMGP